MIHWSKRALKSFDKLDPVTRERVFSAISKLPQGNIKPLSGKLNDISASVLVNGELFSNV